MSLQPSPSLHFQETAVIGAVQVDASAMIAPGVILHAEPGSQIQVAAGVCIGMGSVLHVQAGVLSIGMGANLGTGVLIFGSGEIGENVCVGAGSTIIQPRLAVGQVVPPASLLGDESRQWQDSPIASPSLPEQSLPDPWQEPHPAVPENTPHPNPPLGKGRELGSAYLPQGGTEGWAATTLPEPAAEPAPETPLGATTTGTIETPGQNRPIYGQDYVKQMMGKMYPNSTG
jgi:carbon dioxide concentrating mechanism protein CcmN